MLDDMKDCFQRRNVATLNALSVDQLIDVELRECSVCIIHRQLQLSDQLLARDHVPLRKFGIAISRVRGASQTAYDPLTHVTAQMQNEISDTVRLRICSPPNLFIGEQFEAALDLRQKIFREMVPRARDKELTDFIQIIFHLLFSHRWQMLTSCPSSV